MSNNRKNLGTALKTVIARFTELKENVAGTADSEFEDLDYNKVDKALKTVGVQLKDTTGQFRNLDDVFLELGKKWNTLDRNSQRYIATIAAGSRQQSRFIALMENYERTMQLVDVAQNSAGKSQKQFAKFSDSTEYKLNKLKNTFEQVRISLTGKGVFDTLIEGATEFAERLQGIDLEKILLMAPIALTLGRTMAKQWINGLSEGLQNGKGLINKTIDKVLSKKGRTKAQIELDISQVKNKIQELENDKKRLDILLRESPNFGLVAQLQQAENKIDELKRKINALPADYDRSDPEIQQWQNELAAVNAEAKQLARNLQDADPNAYQNYQARKTTLGNIDKENANVKALTKTSNSILKQAASGVGSALGEGMATAAMMAFTGTFDWSEIFTTTTVQSGISAFTTLLTGNWQMALGQAAVGLASFAAKEITEYFEKQAEIERENADKAYKIAKQIEVEKEEQEKLNEKLDEANQKYDKANEEHQEFQKAVDTYEELSKKILLTEEEQEELNNATQTLIDLHPELVTGYDSAGNAILKMGSAWDEVIKKEKESFQLIQEIQNQAEISAFAQNYKVATEELEHANEILKAVQNLPETENTIRDYGGGVSGALTGFRAYTDAALSFNPALGLIFNTAGGPKPEDYEVGLQDILTDTDEDIDHKIDNLKEWREKNRKYDDLFLLAINEITNENYTNIDNAFKELNKADNLDSFTKKLNEYLEAPEKAAEDAQRKVESLDLVKKATLDEFKKSANNSIKNLLDTEHDLSDFSEQQNNILEQLINISLLKDDDKIQEAMTADDGGWSYFGELASSKNAQQIVEELKKVGPAAQEAISDYYKNLYTRSQEENTKILHQIVSDYHLGEEIEKALTESFSEAANSWEKSYNKIAEAFGAGFENSQLSQILQNSGAEGAKAFENSFAQFDTNEAARIFITNLSKNLEKYSGEIPNEAISYLITYDWSTAEITDLADIKQGFLDYCDTIEGGIDNAEQLWEDYKNYLLQYNVLQTPTLLTIEDLEEQISTSLKDKVEASSGLATAVEKQLENGVLNFSESQSFKEACEKIGLTASDYLSYGLDGTITLDTEALKEGIEAQRLSEAEVLEEVKNQLIAKRDQLETELAIFDAAGSILTEEETRRDLAISIADAYWDAAQAMAAMNPDKVKLGDRQTIRFQDITGADVSAQRAELEKQIEQLTDTINHLSPDSAEYKAFLSEYEAAYTEILKSITDKEEAATKQAEENAKAAADAYEAWEKQVEAVNEKIKELNETIRGSEYFDSGIDSMYNYTTALERVTKAADDARDTLKDLQDTDNASESMDKYLNAIHNEAAISEAEARVYAQAITNGQKVINEKLSKEIEKLNAAAQARAAKTGETVPLMSTDTSGLYSLVGDRYQINLEKVNNLPMNDEIKKMIAEELKSWNDNLDKIEELEKKRSDRIKEYQQLQKDALSNIVNLEEEMKNTLKEKYEQEIADVENKYKAMEEADNNYVDALEEAIKRQRELRERENQWNDLNEKERKLSLMQRDTSGGNRVETRQLEKEVQNDRQQLLDNSVDDIINGLKDMYELQKESREAEIEYRKALLDEGMLMREVTAALANINTADDLVAWFYQNTANLSEMSEEQIKLEEMNWRDMFDAKTSYMEISQADFEEALLITESDIAQVVNETSETLTTKADQTLNQVIDSVDNAIEKMQTDLEQARKDLQEKWEAYLKALEQTAKDAANQNSGNKEDNNGGKTQHWVISRNPSVVTGAKVISSSYNPADHYKYRSLSGVTDAKGTINGGWTKTASPTINGGWTTKIITKAMKDIIEKEDLDKYLKLSTDEKNVIKNNFNTLNEDQREHFLNMRQKYDREVLLGKREKSKLFGFAKGGLVNYTGPAWVDGTKRAPEAFLSAEDTKRIGEAAKILSQIPELNSTTFDRDNITTTTVGDTTININLTIENVSSDYNVDQAVERVKQDIVEAAKYRGSNVILNKHI